MALNNYDWMPVGPRCEYREKFFGIDEFASVDMEAA